MKRIFICMVILMIFTGCFTASAKEAHLIYVDGKIATDYETVLSGDEMFYPFRLITESLGASVTWLGDYRAAVVRYKGCGYWCYTKDGSFYVQKYDYDNQVTEELLTVIEGRGEIIDDKIYIEEDTLAKMLELFGCEFDKEAKSIKGTSKPFSHLIERGEKRERAREIHMDMINNHREELESMASELMTIAEKNGGTVCIARNVGWDNLVSYLYRGSGRHVIDFSLTDEETAALNKFFDICDDDEQISLFANYIEGWVSVSLSDYNFSANLKCYGADSMENLQLHSVYVEELKDGWVYCESLEMECSLQ